jgi:hypothetical protein
MPDPIFELAILVLRKSRQYHVDTRCSTRSAFVIDILADEKFVCVHSRPRPGPPQSDMNREPAHPVPNWRSEKCSRSGNLARPIILLSLRGSTRLRGTASIDRCMFASVIGGPR